MTYHILTSDHNIFTLYPIITCCIPTYPQDGGVLNGAAPKSSNHIYNLDPRAKINYHSLSIYALSVDSTIVFPIVIEIPFISLYFLYIYILYYIILHYIILYYILLYYILYYILYCILYYIILYHIILYHIILYYIIIYIVLYIIYYILNYIIYYIVLLWDCLNSGSKLRPLVSHWRPVGALRYLHHIRWGTFFCFADEFLLLYWTSIGLSPTIYIHMIYI